MALISRRHAVLAKVAALRVDAAPPAGTAFGPPQLQNAYGLSGAASDPSDGETVAVVDAYNDPEASSDLDAYRSAYGLGTCDVGNGCLKIVNQNGAKAGLPASDSSGGWELEESLDLDMVSAICPKCSIILVEANSASISDLAIAESTAVRSGAEAITDSWGSGAEFTGENAYDRYFYAPGVAIAAAGGDDGYGTQYPAASPYVTAVGGTTLSGTMGSWIQTAWSGTGSGCAELEPKPSWQTTDATAPGGCLNRTENDVSAEANPNPGVWVYDTVRDTSLGSSGWAAVGGTSVGTPIVAAAYALADIAAGGPHRALIPGTMPAAYPYQHSSAFTDVTGGFNGICEPARPYLCQAIAGYDGPTGVGTPNGTAGFTGPRTGEVTVLSPGTQVAQAGSRISFQLHVLPGSVKLAFASAGLPGVTVGSDAVLSGKVPTKPRVHRVTVTATAAGLAPGSVTFTIVVVPQIKAARPGAGEVKLDGSGFCLAGLPGFSASPSTQTALQPCAPTPAQEWKFMPSGTVGGSGPIELAGRCLTASAGKALLQRCVRNDRRQGWAYLAGGHLRVLATGDCLAVRGGVSAGKDVLISSCGTGASTDWTLPPAPVLSAVSGRCLTDPGTSSAPGAPVDSGRCSASASQRWTADRNGTIAIAGKCLAVSGDSMLDGAAVDLATCSTSTAQRWLRGPDGQLINANSGRCLAIPGSSGVAGINLIQDDCYGDPGEIWVIS